MSAALAGLKPQREYGVRKADGSWERSEMLRLKRQELEAHYAEGGPVDGFLRLLIYVAIGNGVVDVRPFNAIRRVMQETALGEDLTLEQFKQAVRRQTWLVRNDEKRALATLEQLLPTDQQRRFALELAILLLRGRPHQPGKAAAARPAGAGDGVAQRNGGAAAETVKPATSARRVSASPPAA